MIPEPESPLSLRARAAATWRYALWIGLCLSPLIVYLLAARGVAATDGASFFDAACFDPDMTPAAPPARQALAAAMALAAIAALFVAPIALGVLAIRRTRFSSTGPIGSLALNTAALIALLAVLRLTTGVDRPGLCAGWAAWTLLLAHLAWQGGAGPAVLLAWLRRWWPVLVLGAACVTLAVVVLFPEQALQCFNEDGTETYELARSLRHAFFPAWELEIWELGHASQVATVVTNPSLVNSYWTCAAQVLLGDGEPATRINYWVWSLGIYLLGCRIVAGAAGTSPLLPAVPLAALMLLGGVLFTFYVGYNPYMADVANPGIPDALFTLCLLAGLDSLRTGSRAGFVLSFLLGSLVLYSGPVLLVLTLAAALVWKPLPRRELVTWGALAGGTLALVAAIYLAHGAAAGVLGWWLDALDVEYVNDYLAPVPRTTSALLFFGYFLLGTGVLPAWGIFEVFRPASRTLPASGTLAWRRTLATTALLYLAVVLGSGYKNLHYLAPLWPLAVVLFLTGPRPRRTGAAWTRPLLAAGALAVCLAASWPLQRQTFTLNRQFGRQTTFATDSYLDAVQWGRLRYTLRQSGLMSWDCDQHTWAAYAELTPTPDRARPFLVTATIPAGGTAGDLRAALRPGYEPLAYRRVEGTNIVAVALVNDASWLNWLAAQRPLPPEDRYAVLLLPLARGPYSPHNNLIEDVRRFGQAPEN